MVDKAGPEKEAAAIHAAGAEATSKSSCGGGARAVAVDEAFILYFRELFHCVSQRSKQVLVKEKARKGKPFRRETRSMVTRSFVLNRSSIDYRLSQSCH